MFIRGLVGHKKQEVTLGVKWLIDPAFVTVHCQGAIQTCVNTIENFG